MCVRICGEWIQLCVSVCVCVRVLVCVSVFLCGGTESKWYYVVCPVSVVIFSIIMIIIIAVIVGVVDVVVL